uniref:Uncharacterized protein n=1 Tax=Arundo donax TaxID=35708 RepID=A0A0A9E2Q7_ARUDO
MEYCCHQLVPHSLFDDVIVAFRSSLIGSGAKSFFFSLYATRVS